MKNQNEEVPTSQNGNPASAKFYWLAIGLLIVVFICGQFSGDPQIAKAVNVALVVATLALGMKFGFAWVSSAAERDPSSPTVVATRPDPLQAAPLVSLLESNGINAVATGMHTSGFQVEIASDVKIVVPKRDAAEALKILGDEAKG